jgi:hypothetical protein
MPCFFLGGNTNQIRDNLLLGVFRTTLFNVGLAVPQKAGSNRANPLQTASVTHKQAVVQCQKFPSQATNWAFIEACFKEKTGICPFQAKVNSTNVPADSRQEGGREGERERKSVRVPLPQSTGCAPLSGVSKIEFVRL